MKKTVTARTPPFTLKKRREAAICAILVTSLVSTIHDIRAQNSAKIRRSALLPFHRRGRARACAGAARHATSKVEAKGTWFPRNHPRLHTTREGEPQQAAAAHRVQSRPEGNVPQRCASTNVGCCPRHRASVSRQQCRGGGANAGGSGECITAAASAGRVSALSSSVTLSTGACCNVTRRYETTLSVSC